jgi:hypothetical protein
MCDMMTLKTVRSHLRKLVDRVERQKSTFLREQLYLPCMHPNFHDSTADGRVHKIAT